jgi:uncharacterized protein (TIGR03437 family)
MRLPQGLFLCAISLHAQVSVLTYHNDLSRTGQNLEESALTPTTVSSPQFGLLFRDAVDGEIYAQPLYMPEVNIPGKGAHNVVFVATEHDSVYAFDADRAGTPPLWHVNFTNPALGTFPATSASLECESIVPEIGITSTPVIDPKTQTLYVVAMTSESSSYNYVHRLHALDLATGAERPGSPVVIEASAPGKGDGNTTVQFRPWLYKQRAGLLLLNGVVYTAWSSHCDAGNYHGWLIGYDAKTLQQAAVFAVTPDWYEGALWQGGAAPAADGNGNIYVVSGNGTFTAAQGGSDLGESVIKLSTAKGLSVADYFTPFNNVELSEEELDLGSSGALLLPDEAGSPAHPHLLVTGSKEGRVYVIDRDHMGGFQANSDSQIVQSLPSMLGAVVGIPAYFNNTVYFSGTRDALKAFSVSAGLLSDSPVSQTLRTFPAPGMIPSISALGSSNGIVWAIDSTAQLHAFDASNLANELFKGSTGSYVKFSTPTIANGKVYVGTTDSLAVFGLSNAPHLDSIVSAASFSAGPAAPGSIVSIFGSNLSTRPLNAKSAPLPTALGDFSLRVNGIPSPIFYVSPAQANAQIPYDVPTGQATLVATAGGILLPPISLTIQPTAANLWMLGPNQALVENEDGTINGSKRPASPGSVVTAYLTGQGSLDLPIASGAAAPDDPLVRASAATSATIGKESADVLFAGMAPGMVGVYQVNVRVPQLAAGSYPLAVAIGASASNSALITVGR